MINNKNKEMYLVYIWWKICEVFEVDPIEVYKRRRFTKNVKVRNIFFLLAYSYTPCSLTEVGDFFSNKQKGYNHENVIHGIKTFIFHWWNVSNKEIVELASILKEAGFVKWYKSSGHNKSMKHNFGWVDIEDIVEDLKIKYK